MSEAHFDSPSIYPEEIYTVDQLHSFLAECLGPLQMMGGKLRAFVPWRKGLCHVLPPREGYPSARLFVDDGSGRRLDPQEVFSYTLGKDLDYSEFKDKFNDLIRKHKGQEDTEEDEVVVIPRKKLKKALEKLMKDFGIS